MFPEQIYDVIHYGLFVYGAAAAAASIIWAARELRQWLVSREAAQLDRMKMQHDYAVYAQQIMLEQTRLMVELEKTRKTIEP